MSNKPNNASFANPPFFGKPCTLLIIIICDEGGLIICQLLHLAVSITEDRKNKNMGKTGIHGSSPCFYFLCCPKNCTKKTFIKIRAKMRAHKA